MDISYKQRLRSSYDAIAPKYEDVADLQLEVIKRMGDRLEFFKTAPQKIVDLGSGTGLSRKVLKRKFRKAFLIELDISLGMLSLAKKKSPGVFLLPQRRMSYVCADMENLPLKPGCVDLVWSNLAMEWATSLPDIVAEISKILSPGGLLMFSTLGPDTLKELRIASQKAGLESPVNRFYDMHDFGDALIRGGLTDPVMDVDLLSLDFQSLDHLFSELRLGGSVRKDSGKLSSKDFDNIKKFYPKEADGGAKIRATFEVVFGHAWAPPKKNIDRYPVIEIRSE